MQKKPVTPISSVQMSTLRVYTAVAKNASKSFDLHLSEIFKLWAKKLTFPQQSAQQRSERRSDGGH